MLLQDRLALAEGERAGAGLEGRSGAADVDRPVVAGEALALTDRVAGAVHLDPCRPGPRLGDEAEQRHLLFGRRGAAAWGGGGAGAGTRDGALHGRTGGGRARGRRGAGPEGGRRADDLRRGCRSGHGPGHRSRRRLLGLPAEQERASREQRDHDRAHSGEQEQEQPLAGAAGGDLGLNGHASRHLTWVPVVTVPPAAGPDADPVAWKADKLMAADSSSGGAEADAVVAAGGPPPQAGPPPPGGDNPLASRGPGRD